MFVPKSRAGQSLTEYLLIASLIALISIGGLSLLGNSLSLSFKGLISGERKALPPANAYLLSKAGGSTTGSGGNTTGVGGETSGSTDDAGKSCVSDGWCLDLNKIETSEQNSTQTTGSNGTEMVTQYSDVLSQIEAMVQDMPDVDPTLKAYIINSANDGHAIATEQQSGSSQSMNDATIGFIYRSDNLRSYLAEHPAALPGPVIEVINRSLNSIQKISVGYMKQSTPNYYEFYQIPSNLQVADDGDFSLSDFAKKVKKDANSVCKAGKADPDCTQ